MDLAVTKSLRPWLDLNVEIDNLTDKIYYETQNYFESRVSRDSAGNRAYTRNAWLPVWFHRGSHLQAQRKVRKAQFSSTIFLCRLR